MRLQIDSFEKEVVLRYEFYKNLSIADHSKPLEYEGKCDPYEDHAVEHYFGKPVDEGNESLPAMQKLCAQTNAQEKAFEMTIPRLRGVTLTFL